MANPRLLVKRRKAVRNIRKITRTMQLIATARFQKVLAKATASKPYAEKITELVQELSAAGAQTEHPLLKKNPKAEKSAVWILTSNRGLCGGFNSSILRTALAHLDSLDHPADVYVVGKKGVTYLRFIGRPITRAITDFPDTPSFGDVEPFAEEAMAQYAAGEYRSIDVVYQQFLSAARQVPTRLRLLPLRAEDLGDAEDAGEDGDDTVGQVQYDFSPRPDLLLAELLPVTVKVRMFQCFMDNTVSEQVARMVAMKSATDAADEMIKSLSRQYNRARQTQITSELLDIIGGAEALQ